MTLTQRLFGTFWMVSALLAIAACEDAGPPSASQVAAIAAAPAAEVTVTEAGAAESAVTAPPEECEECRCASKDGDGNSLSDLLKKHKLQSCSSPYYACKLTSAPTPATYEYTTCEYDDREKQTGCGVKRTTVAYSCSGRYKPDCGGQQPTHYPVLSCKEREYETGTPPRKVKYCGVDKYGDSVQGPKLTCGRNPVADWKGEPGHELVSTCSWLVDDLGVGTCLGHCTLLRYVPDLENGGCKRDTGGGAGINTSFACEKKAKEEFTCAPGDDGGLDARCAEPAEETREPER